MGAILGQNVGLIKQYLASKYLASAPVFGIETPFVMTITEADLTPFNDLMKDSVTGEVKNIFFGKLIASMKNTGAPFDYSLSLADNLPGITDTDQIRITSGQDGVWDNSELTLTEAVQTAAGNVIFTFVGWLIPVTFTAPGFVPFVGPVAFGNVASGVSVQTNFPVTGTNLVEDITCTLSGADAAEFQVSNDGLVWGANCTLTPLADGSFTGLVYVQFNSIAPAGAKVAQIDYTGNGLTIVSTPITGTTT